MKILFTFILTLFSAHTVFAQAWSGILPTTRAIDWTHAGVVGGIPSAAWPICATINPEGTAIAPVAPSDISTAVTNCAVAHPTGGVVLLAPGNFYFNSALGTTSNVALRGSGADKTLVYLISNSSTYGYFVGGGSGSGNHANWTGGFAKGTTSITIDANGGTLVPGKTFLMLQQCDTGFSAPVSWSNGSPVCTTGTNHVDTGEVFNCHNNANFCSEQGSSLGYSSQIQNVLVTAVSGTGPWTVTISPGLYHSNWSSANATTAQWQNVPNSNQGIEDMSIDATGSGAQMQGVLLFLNCYNCWAKGNRIIFYRQQQIAMNFSAHLSILNNYIPIPLNGQGTYGIANLFSTDCLIENNIVPAITPQGGTNGDVYGYNFVTGNFNFFSNNQVANRIQPHEASQDYTLWEGNQVADVWVDGIHGIDFFETFFRNQATGEQIPFTQMTAQSDALVFTWGKRFFNAIGNVLGTQGWTVNYEHRNGGGTTSPSVFNLGGNANFFGDQQVWKTLLRWGNCDPITAGCKFDSTEVPTSLTKAIGFKQQLGTGNGSQTVFTGTLANLPCSLGDNVVYIQPPVYSGTTAYSPGNQVSYGGAGFVNVVASTGNPPIGINAFDSHWASMVGTDDFTGTIQNPASQASRGGGGTGNNVSGTVNCTTGAVSVTFSPAPASGVPVYFNYVQITPSTTSIYAAVPLSSHTLPNSFYRTATSKPAGTAGTGLPFRKVCTNYTTAGGCGGTYSYPAFPFNGPDVTGGNGFGGFANDIPAAVAWKNLPVDPAYQNSYTVTAATWTSGKVTLTVTGFGTFGGSGVLGGNAGEFTLTGMNPSGYNCNQCQLVTGLNGQVSYALAVNPGTYISGGTFQFPNIRVWNETVFQTDSSTNPVVPITAPAPVNFADTSKSEDPHGHGLF